MSPVSAALAAFLALPLAASAESPPVTGRIESDEGRIEILGRPVRVGETIELPEGFIRVEEEGPEDGQIGSFGIVSAESLGSAASLTSETVVADDPAAAAAPRERECRAERTAYIAELWRESGIELSDPVALIEGLQAGDAGPATGYYWFALATDPFRPLARSSELRARAERLVRCMNGG